MSHSLPPEKRRLEIQGYHIFGTNNLRVPYYAKVSYSVNPDGHFIEGSGNLVSYIDLSGATEKLPFLRELGLQEVGDYITRFTIYPRVVKIIRNGGQLI
jgi:hypothetical protein